MSYDASCLLSLSDAYFITHMSVAYPQLHGLLQIPPSVAINSFLHDLHTAQEAVQEGTTQDGRQQKLYCQWADLCVTLLVNPDLQYPSIPRIELLQVYGHRFRHVRYPKRHMDRLGK